MPLHGAKGDNYSLSDSHISMKNAYSWDWKQLIKRLTLPHSCLCLQRGSISDNSGSVGPLCVSLLFCLGVFNIIVTRHWPRCFVFPKLTFNQETSQLLFVLCSVHHFSSRHLSGDPEQNDSAMIYLNIYTYSIQ